MTDKMNAPLLFTCASRVHMPHVGADQTDLKPQDTISLERPLLKTTKHDPAVNTNYVKKISMDLAFAEDVVKERCMAALPYSDKYFYEALDISDLISPPPRARKPQGRHDSRVREYTHMPCHIRKKVPHKLKPVKRKILERALEMHQKAAEEAPKGTKDIGSSGAGSIFLTQASVAELGEGNFEGKIRPQDSQWDEYLMSVLSPQTARWIVMQRMSPSDHQDKLISTLQERYGPATDNSIDLVKDNVSEPDDSDNEDQAEKRKWKRNDETLLERIHAMQQKVGKPTVPYADDSAAAFYRLPAGFRRAKKHQDKEEAGAINATAHAIDVRPYTPPPPPTLRDHVNPAVGDKLYDTDNRFEQEWLTGAEQIYQKGESKNMITLDTNNKYVKVLQKESPRPPQHWYNQGEEEGKRGTNPSHKFQRGLHRWKTLPEPIDQEGSMTLLPVDNRDILVTGKDTSDKYKVRPPAMNGGPSKSPDPTSRRNARNNGTLVKIVDEWRSKWHLDMRYADASPQDLIRDMADIHPHIRLKAITTCARAAEYKPPPEMGIKLEHEKANDDQVRLLPEDLFAALQCLLDDPHQQVKRAAAIALYTLERPVTKAEDILRLTLLDHKSVDRWTAAQCLAYYGECDSEVVGELVYQLLNSEDTIRHEQAAYLLGKLSENSTLVHSMLAEQLNSSSWRHRVISCKVIPKLYGHINKDLVHKLVNLMWHDWHSEVRKAAAQTLGKTGHGKDVHDELRDKILTGSERNRTEAITRVGQLGIMTAKLLPAFLQCFHDSYVSVRMEVCIACTNLKISDEQVLDKLVYLATYDPIWKIKALALQAFGLIGVMTPTIRECILWAFRYEEQSGVRAEACHTVRFLAMTEDDVAQILQDRYLVETSQLVKDEIGEALKMFGIEATEDMDMVAQVKGEVRKLCTRNNVCAQITVNEAADTKQANIDRMIYKTKPKKSTPVQKDPTHNQETRVSSRKSNRVQFKDISKKKEPEETKSRPVSRVSQHSATSKPRKLITPSGGTSTPGPYSRENTLLTPTADLELQSILDKSASDRMTPDTNVTESRPNTSKTVKSGITDDDDVSDNGGDDIGRESLPPSRMKSDLEQIDEQAGENAEDDLDVGDNTVVEAQGGVGVTLNVEAAEADAGGTGEKVQSTSRSSMTNEDSLSTGYAGTTSLSSMVGDPHPIDTLDISTEAETTPKENLNVIDLPGKDSSVKGGSIQSSISGQASIPSERGRSQENNNTTPKTPKYIIPSQLQSRRSSTLGTPQTRGSLPSSCDATKHRMYAHRYNSDLPDGINLE